jgi:hypothetical protein
VFSDYGIPVTEDSAEGRLKARYICAITVGENLQKMAAGTMYTPELTIRLSDGVGTLFSYAARLERLGAQNPDLARRRAYSALANHIQSAFAPALAAKLGF